ncbi:hypothetical protein PWA37_001369 [Arxiozyma heterogenica]
MIWLFLFSNICQWKKQ